MRLIYLRGKKHPKDIKIVFECECGRKHAPTFEEIVDLVVVTYRNEELLYPRSLGFQGGRMILKLIRDCIRANKLPDKEMLRKYMLDKTCEVLDRRF